MKLKIKKQHQKLTIEYASSASQAPVTVTLDKSEALLLVSMLKAALAAETFSFELSQ